VADNSVAPLMPRGHTASTALIIAEHGGRIIASQLRGEAGASVRRHPEVRDCQT
jgi:hypothetical protein